MKATPARGTGPLTILVATDGSRGSDAALNFAARLLSRDPAAGLTVITVASKNGSKDGAPKRPDDLPPALAAATRRLRARGIAPAVRCLAHGAGEVPEAIAREAHRMRADLVVVGSEGRDTLSEWVVGGNALRLIYLARCPVVVVRPPRRRRSS